MITPDKRKTTALRILISLAAISLLAGLPQSPFTVIKNINKKSAGQVELLLPSDSLSKHLSVDPCSEKSLESIYDSVENYNPAKSGLNVFKARLAKELKAKNFNNLAIKVMAGAEDSLNTSKTCLLPLKASAESSLAVDLNNQLITEVALGKQSVFCSKGKAYLLDDSFYSVESVLKSYAKQIKDKKAVAALKKQLAGLKDKKSKLSKNKKSEKLKLEKDIRRVSLSISYAQYFSKDAELLSSFYNSVCAQSALIVTPNSKPVVPTTAPEKTIAPIKTATVAATATKTATAIKTATPTSTPVSNRITAPSLLSPAASNTLDTIYTLSTGSSSLTISWNRVEYKPGSARYLVRAVDLSNNSSIITSGNSENYSTESITFTNLQAGRKYRFWLHSAKEQIDYTSGSHTYSEQVDFFFSVPGSVVTTATPTAIVPATATSVTPETVSPFSAYNFTKVFQNGIYQQYIGNTWSGGTNTPYGDHLFYNFMIDGYGGLPMGSCLQRSQFITNPTERAICARTENSDLFRAGTNNSSPTRHLLVKNVMIKNAFRPINVVGGTAMINGVPVANSVQKSVDKPHTDTFQAYMGSVSSSMSQDTINKVGWLVIQDSVFKNSDNGAMVHGDTHYKGALYQNLSTFCEDAFKQDTYARNANDGKNYPGNQGVQPAYPCGNQIAFGTYYNAPVWLVNVSTSINSVVVSNPTFGPGSGPVIVVGNQVNIQGYGNKKPIYKKDANGNDVLDADGKPIIVNWSAAETVMNPSNVVRFNYIEDALAAGYARPPYIELSCSGWKNPPAGCELRQGYLNK